MGENVIIPRQGQTMTEATIGKWLKRDGDKVTEGENLLEITTDKVTIVLESPKTGVLKILAHEGDIILVYGVVGVINDEI